MKFSCTGDIGNGSVTIRQHTNVEKPDQDVSIALSEPVTLTFSLKYLVNFCKASGLSSKVRLCLSQEVPLLVEYGLTGNSHLRFYLAPKVCTDNCLPDIYINHHTNTCLIVDWGGGVSGFRKWRHLVLRSSTSFLSIKFGNMRWIDGFEVDTSNNSQRAFMMFQSPAKTY